MVADAVALMLGGGVDSCPIEPYPGIGVGLRENHAWLGARQKKGRDFS
jgi:hypothetical protein